MIKPFLAAAALAGGVPIAGIVVAGGDAAMAEGAEFFDRGPTIQDRVADAGAGPATRTAAVLPASVADGPPAPVPPCVSSAMLAPRYMIGVFR